MIFHSGVKQRGFTLVEMLVVIAILSVLIAIVVPLSTKMRKFADDATCKTRLRTIGIAMQAYYTDHEEFPSSQHWVGKAAGRHHSGQWAEWAFQDNIRHGTLWEYTGNERTYICPTFQRVYQRNPAFANVPAYVSYAMNEYFNPPGRDANGNFTRGSWQHSHLNLFHGKRNEVLRPNRLALVGEENTWKTPHNRWVINNLALGVGSWPSGVVDGIASFHDPDDPGMVTGYSNVVFFDLHVGRHHNTESRELFTPKVIKDAVGGP